MKTLIATLLVSSIAFAADPPAPDLDSPVLAPDIKDVSVRLRAGETAPFDGRLLSLEENLRRGAMKASCDAELSEAKTNVWTSKPVLVAVILGAAALGAAAGAGITVWALKKNP